MAGFSRSVPRKGRLIWADEGGAAASDARIVRDYESSLLSHCKSVKRPDQPPRPTLSLSAMPLRSAAA